MFPNVRGYENRRQFPISKRVRPVFPPQTCASAHATKANGVVAIRLSCQLGKANPGVVPALGDALTSRRDVLFFAFVNCKHRRRNFAAYRKHYSRSEGRDCKIEPGGPVIRGQKEFR